MYHCSSGSKVSHQLSVNLEWSLEFLQIKISRGKRLLTVIGPMGFCFVTVYPVVHPVEPYHILCRDQMTHL